MMLRKLSKLKRVFDFNDPVKQIKKNGFWFIDIPRTSSTAIKIELSKIYGSSYGKSNVLEKGYGEKSYFKDHLTAQDAKALFTEDVWGNLFTFTMIRNPWDRMVSLYFYRKKKGHIPPTLEFNEYIIQLKAPRYKAARSMHSRPAYHYGLAEYILDKNDELIVDYIGRYENREESLEKISQQINCPKIGELCLQRAKPTGSHYSKFYSAETRKLVGNVFAKDIELFGYEFDSLS